MLKQQYDLLLSERVYFLPFAAGRSHLVWDRVDMKNRIVNLKTQETKERRKKIIPLFDIVYDMLCNLPRGIHTTHVFLRNGKPFQYDGNCQRYWQRACQESDIEDFHFHDLRHTCITRLVMEGYPVSFIMEMTGHTNFNTHSRYCNLNGEGMWTVIGQYQKQTVTKMTT